MRSIGNVDLTIGLVTIPVKMTGISDSHDRKGSMYHAHDDGSYGKVKMPKTCEVCNRAVPPGEIAKGFEEAGSTVMLSSDEMETIAANTSPTVAIDKFITAAEVDPMLFADENIYRLVPDAKRGRQAVTTYLAVCRMLAERNLAGVVQYVRWGRNHLALLEVEPSDDGGVLILRNMMWPDELRTAEFQVLADNADTELDPRLMPVMESVVESMTGEWNPADYTDTYTEALNAAIEAKAAGGEIETVVSEAGGAVDNVDDLIAKLEASVAKAPAKKTAPRRRTKKEEAA